MAAFTVYWQPGCSSCLRAKEFLTAHGIDFVSVNVREDQKAVEHLTTRGIKTVPVVMRGPIFVHGQDLDELARFVGVDLKRKKLAPHVLVHRTCVVLSATARYVRQLPGDALARPMPGRDRTALDLAYHVGMVPTAFLDAIRGGAVSFEHFERRAPADATAKDVAKVLHETAADFAAWWMGGSRPNTVKTYYGEQPLHNMLERTAWHAAQHARQVMTLVTNASLIPDVPLTTADLEGLPLPREIYDDEVKLAG